MNISPSLGKSKSYEIEVEKWLKWTEIDGIEAGVYSCVGSDWNGGWWNGGCVRMEWSGGNLGPGKYATRRWRHGEKNFPVVATFSSN